MNRKFGMSYATLMYKSRNIASFMTRDIAQFTGFGIVAADVTAFLALIDAFEALPTDEELIGAAALATEAKDAKIAEILSAIRLVLVRVATKYGLQSAMYTQFRAGRLNDIADKNLGDMVRKTVRLGTEYLADLASEGLTAAMLTNITTLSEELQDLLVVQSDANADRDIAAVKRLEKANGIYDLLVRYCAYGKVMWENVNEAKYNDYVIYDADDVPHTPTAAPTGLQVNMITLALTWTAVAGATGYKVKYKFPADSGRYVDAHDGILHTTEFTLAPQPESFKVVVLANNAAGLSAASAELLVAAALAAPGGFVYDHVAGKFVWVMVAGVTFYRLEASYDGGVTWQKISAQDFATGEYVWSPPPGIFRLRGELNGAVSAWVYATIA